MSARGRGSSERRSTRQKKNNGGSRRSKPESETPEGQSSRTTTDHEEIREWAEQRGGRPACVKGTGGGDDMGIIRLEFPGSSYSNDEKGQDISWDEFFEKFEAQRLALGTLVG